MSRSNSNIFEAFVDVALSFRAKEYPDMTRDLKSELPRLNCTKKRTPKARKTSSTWTTDLGSVLRLLGQGTASAPDMSIRELEDLIRDMGGYSLKLIIEKELYHSDVDDRQKRLSMPGNQILSDDFLSPKEKMILNGSTKKRGSKAENGVDVGFIGPCREETTMVLKKWSYATSSSYVLINNWYEIAMKNGLNEGDVRCPGLVL
ncbi:hypothetical protein TIFTF001_012915 [Ficus carica]|uniref:Uncharacterized protein n=1 Tax=Ficus carica TaxID=3494 RepID=A0AA88D5J4_FICCA|nr:hypothetical protein TIFTF001_012915 [Ficus carica]